ncbi:hypothetical protein Dsin_019558 [Dipteronia sinensis]|uniref:CCHC-type domain-containing protein n=1 Tax=Dipteronia sinensis TaxID=43782 RepID=A0AAE0E2M2_9ROSI|nr:hypothetical protein Dsin_019558 [Dipteronia sinensis]
MCESSNTAANMSIFSPSDGQGQAKNIADQAQRGLGLSNNFGRSRPTAAAAMGTKETPRGAPNPYSRLGGIKCYMCGQPGHCSNECPARKPVNFVDTEQEEEQNFENEGNIDEFLEGAEIADEF